MIRIAFFSASDKLVGFHITGHSDYSEAGSDIVCAAVSSAAYMTANTVTDIIGLDPVLTVSDGEMLLRCKTMQDAVKAAEILGGFHLHIMGLYEEYPEYINVTNTEV